MTQQDSNNRKRTFKSLSGQELEPHYTPEPSRQLEKPAEAPFTRGIHPEMYRQQLWTMRQYSGFGDATETNHRFKLILSQGGSGLSTAFDLPTQLGLDCDNSLAVGEVGRTGVSISTIEDLDLLLQDIPLNKISLSMTINATAPILMAFLLVLAERRGIPWSDLRGTVQNDILKEYLARGNYIYPIEPALQLSADLIRFCCEQVPQWNSISISGYHIREAGSTAVQELAFTFANALCYIEATKNLGIAPEKFVGRLAFFFNAQIDFLEEIAKFRAARRIWSNLLGQRFGIENSDLLKLRFHTQTAGSSLTAQQPLNNIARTTIEALAAVLGGTQSLHTNAHDEALGLPTAASSTTALRIQQIIAEESGCAAVVDPLGGAFAIEELCDCIEKDTLDLIAKIEQQGGMLQALKSSWAKNEIEKSAYLYQQQLEKQEHLQIGVNAYQEFDQADISLQTINPQLEQKQIDRIHAYKANRDLLELNKAINQLKAAAAQSQPIMPAILAAVRVGATLGELAGLLKELYGAQDY